MRYSVSIIRMKSCFFRRALYGGVLLSSKTLLQMFSLHILKNDIFARYFHEQLLYVLPPTWIIRARDVKHVFFVCDAFSLIYRDHFGLSFFSKNQSSHWKIVNLPNIKSQPYPENPYIHRIKNSLSIHYILWNGAT